MNIKKIILGLVAFGHVAFADQSIDIITGVTSGTVVNSSGTAFTTFDSTTFADADAGGAIQIITTPHGRWLPSLAAEPSAVWVGDDANRSVNNSMLFAFPFTVTDTIITNATIQLNYAVDNFLGDTTNSINGIFINNIGQPAVDTNSVGGDYRTETITTSVDITSFVQPGNNVLYLYARDGGAASGLMAYANIQITGSSVTPVSVAEPKQIPSTTIWGLLLMTVSIVGFVVSRKKKG